MRGNSRRSARLLRTGAVLVGIGTVVTIATLFSLFTGSEPLPLAFYLLCFLAPLGVGLILWGLLELAASRRAITDELVAGRQGEPTTA